MRQLIERGSSPLPQGTLAVGAGLVTQGLTAYLFLFVAGRTLGPERYSYLAVLWTLVFFAAPGFLFPVEQEVSRAVSVRRALGFGGGPVIRRAAALAGVVALGLVATVVTLHRPILEHLFDGEGTLLLALALALPAYAAMHVTRGALSGAARFGAYGTLIGLEGVLRVAAAVGLALVGFDTVGAYGLLIAAAPVIALLLVAPRQREVLRPGPQANWSELSQALVWLLLGSVLSQGFVNASVPLVQVLASEDERALAGQFQAGLLITRVPLFLFQAVQAALLPALAGLAAKGRLADFRTGLWRLVVVVVTVGGLATAGAFLVGPLVLRVSFGKDYDELRAVDLGLLALASAAFMLATALAQALIALGGHARVAGGFCVGIAVFAVATALGSELLLRVEVGMVLGSFAAVTTLAVLLAGQLRRGVPPDAQPLIDAISPEHEIIEP